MPNNSSEEGVNFDNGSSFYNDNLDTGKHNVNMSHSSPPVVYVYKYVVLQNPVTLQDVIPFIAVFAIYCVVIHTFFTILKKIHRQSYNFLIFTFVAIFPPLTMLILSDYPFLILWGFLFAFMLYCLRICFSTSLLAKEKPKTIYQLFRSIFMLTNAGICLGQVSVVFSTLVYPKSIKMSLRILIYFLYFAVFCREVMINLSKIMAHTTGFYNKDGIPGRQEDTSKCMICIEALGDSDGHSNSPFESKVITLSCGHSFHNGCLKGWTLIGNNKHCIYCKRGIDMSIIEPDMWMKAELAVKPLMNGLRSSISFLVVLYLYMVVRLRS